MSYRGWWGESSKLLSSINMCFTNNHPPGLTQVKYTVPVNMAFPDNVSVIKEFKFTEADMLLSSENMEIFGSVYPYIFEANPVASKSRQVNISGARLQAKLYISPNQYSASKVCSVINYHP